MPCIFLFPPGSKECKATQVGHKCSKLRDGLIYCTACVHLHIRWWSGASFHMCWPRCSVWNLTITAFTFRTMKLNIIFLLAVVNMGTSNYHPTEGTSCEMVRWDPYSGPLGSGMRLGPPCYQHCANSHSLWKEKSPRTRLSVVAEVAFAGLGDR